MMTAEERQEKLRDLVRIFRQFRDLTWDESGNPSGEIVLGEENLDSVLTLDRENLLRDPIPKDRASLLGHRQRITLRLPRWQEAYFAKNLNSMLTSIVIFKFEQPPCFYLAESDYLHPDDRDRMPAPVIHYLETLRLIGLLKGVSDYIVPRGGERRLIFLLKGKLELRIDYAAGDLRQITGLDEIEETLNSDLYKIQMQDILKAALIETLKDVQKGRFVYILRHCSEFFQRFKENLQLFLSDFSFAKIRDEVEEYSLEYTAKLNNVFADIQNKMLAIPVVLVIAAGQMEDVAKLSLKNCAVLLGAIAFSVLMHLLIVNQKDTLSAINEEIKREKAKKEGKYKEIAPDLSNPLAELGRRYQHQVQLLRSVQVLVWVALLFPLGVFVFFTPAVWDLVKATWNLLLTLGEAMLP